MITWGWICSRGYRNRRKFVCHRNGEPVENRKLQTEKYSRSQGIQNNVSIASLERIRIRMWWIVCFNPILLPINLKHWHVHSINNTTSLYTIIYFIVSLHLFLFYYYLSSIPSPSGNIFSECTFTLYFPCGLHCTRAQFQLLGRNVSAYQQKVNLLHLSGAAVDACGGTSSATWQLIWFLPRDTGGGGSQFVL